MAILPYILDEADVYYLTDSQLSRLASCTTSMLLPSIRKYIDSTDVDEVVHDRIVNAYKSRLAQLDFLASAELKAVVEELSVVGLTSVNYNVPDDTLKQWKSNIDIALYDENSAMYIAPIKGDVIEGICSELSGDTEGGAKVALKLAAASSYFKEDKNKSYQGTILKQILKNQSDYRIISRGIGWLLEKKQKGVQPGAWRVL